MIDIKNRARDKAFSKINSLNIEVRDLQTDLRLGQSLVEDEHLESMIKTSKRELKLWEYIAELIEKDI
jgi:hypothetical protein